MKIKKIMLIVFIITPLLLTACNYNNKNSENSSTDVLAEEKTTEGNKGNEVIVKKGFNEIAPYQYPLIEGWEKAKETPEYTILQKDGVDGCLVIASEVDVECKQNMDAYLSFMGVKNRMSYFFNGLEYETISYYNETPYNETVNERNVMTEEPLITMRNIKNKSDKKEAVIKFYHTMDITSKNSLLYGFVGTAENAIEIDEFVRSTINEVRTIHTEATKIMDPENVELANEQIFNGSGSIKALVPSQWFRSDLGKNGVVYKATLETGKDFNCTSILFLKEKVALENGDPAGLLEKNDYRLANSTMQHMTEDAVHIQNCITYKTEYEEIKIAGEDVTRIRGRQEFESSNTGLDDRIYLPNGKEIKYTAYIYTHGNERYIILSSFKEGQRKIAEILVEKIIGTIEYL
ncbi:MAG: hypothetical protein ACRCU3_01870 [Eubacteriaceae bacterium]